MMLKRFFAFGLGNVLTALIPFLLLPFLTKFLSPDEMGSVAFLESLIMLLAPLIIFGIDGSYSAFYQKFDAIKRKNLSVSLLQLSLVITVLLIPIVIVTGYKKFLPVTIDSFWIYLILVLFYSRAINALYFSRLQMDGKAMKYAILKVSIASISAVVTVYAILQIEATAESRLMGIYSGPIIASFICVFLMYKQGVFSHELFRKDLIKKSFSFGVGMVIHSWGAIVFFASDRVIIGYLENTEALGQYYIAVQIGMVMAIIQNTFSQVWTPHSFGLFYNKKNKQYIREVKFSIAFLLVSCFIVMLAIPLFYSLLIDPIYHEMMLISYWVVATYFFLGLYKVNVVKLFYFERTKLLAKITFFSAVFNVLLTIVLVQFIGAFGAAIATFISSIIYALMVYRSAKTLKVNEL